ncbi:MAG: universal stress protein, partial [Bacteroidetes bacterium]
FSTTSDAAVVFAKQLGQRLKAQLQVVHCWVPFASDPTSMDDHIIWGEAEEHYKTQLTAFLNQHDLPAKAGILRAGFPGEVIVELSRREDTLLLIMGTLRAYGAFEKLIGSVATYVCRHTAAPVLLIPPEVHFNDHFKKVLVAGETDAISEENLQQTLSFLLPLGAQIAFTNIDAITKADAMQVSKDTLQRITQGQSGDLSVAVAHITSTSTEEGLNQYCTANDIDLLVLLLHKHPWWERLFKQTLKPEKVAIELHRPILMMPLSK